MPDRIITKIVWDMETWEVLERVEIPYSGIWHYCLGGASAGEKGDAADESEFMASLKDEQSQQFAQEQEAQQIVQSAWAPIAKGGAYQYGFSTAEDQAQQSAIVNAGAEAVTNTENAAQLREQQQSGGAATAPTGASEAINAQIAATGAQSTATNLGNEKLAGYEQGSKLFSEATGAEEDVAKLSDPTGYASAETGAANAANSLNQTVDTANANSLTSKLLGGAITGGVGFLTGGPAGALSGFASGFTGKPTPNASGGASGGSMNPTGNPNGGG